MQIQAVYQPVHQVAQTVLVLLTAQFANRIII